MGTNIPSKMIIPPDAPKDVDEIVLYYEKNGVVKEFPVINNQVTMPDTADHAWVFKESKRHVIKVGYKPPIHDFSINTEQSDDITSTVLADTSYSFLFLSHNADQVKPDIWKKIQDYDRFAGENGHKFYMITSSTKSATGHLKNQYHLNFNFHYMDETTLKTIIRADPGLVLLKHGTILGMWHYNDFPQTSYFRGDILSKVLTDYNKSIEWKRIFILMLAFGIVVMGLYMGRGKH
jgi:triosephosphate isomerase